jgi:hypothetical protein
MPDMYIPPSSDIMNDIERGRYSECTVCGSTVALGRYVQHTNFHKTFTNRLDQKMATAMWCDTGNHAFKAGAAGSIHFQGSQTGEDGRTTTVDIDACAAHNPYNNDKKAELKALEATASDELHNETSYL